MGGKELSQKVLKECLSYSAENGLFIWNINRPLEHFKTVAAQRTYKGRFAGKEAGHHYFDKKSGQTYIQIRLFGKLYLAHRLAWFYETGKWPESLIDHKDGVGTNNKMNNLREVDVPTNGKNCTLSKNNTSGVNGVYWNKANKNWVAEGHYTEDGLNKKKHLGCFSCLEDAKAARLAWENSVGGFTERHGKALDTPHNS